MRRLLGFGPILILLFTLAQAETIWLPTGDTIPPADSVWRPLVKQLTDPVLDTLAIELADFTISKVDFSLEIQEGRLYLFQPLEIDGQSLHYGGFFVGKATMFFKPPIRTEIAQMQRFYKQDSILIDVQQAIIYCDQDLLWEMQVSGQMINGLPGRKSRKFLSDGIEVQRNATDFADGLRLLRQIVFPQAEPALYVQAVKARLDQTIYEYEPISREEVRLVRIHHKAVGPERICSYYQFVDESLENINGESREALDPLEYAIEATIDLAGDVWAEVKMRALVLDPSCQFLFYALHDKAEIDGIELADGTPVEWLRESREALQSTTLGVM